MADRDKRRGLGRGLSALMADVAETQTVASEGAAEQYVPIEKISPNPEQPRKRFDPQDLDDLANSIREKGVIQPLIVRRRDDGTFEIVAGERRWRASQMAQLHELPIIVREFTDVEVLEVAIIENIQRADLNSIEEAAGYRQLMDRFGHTQEKMAEALGKSRSHIANLLRLLNLPEDVLELVRQGDLTAGHARTLVPSKNPEKLAKQIIAGGLSVRAAEALIKKEHQAENGGSEKRTARPTGEKDADTRALEGDLSANLGLKVTLNHKPGQEAGQMVLHYTTMDELDELCQRLSAS
ncbi:ParB/RepB/Spo0J family partition protein [Sulfitobacter sp. M220]|jgi:ParB family chromosome partitioning protein|uniref:Chromosome segregation DNA-binding protein n=2 Tax=root TaxID=1 RepID=A0A1H0NL71_9RHOB|nr:MULTISPECIES: ParB/RepB/Spo0J family partition protein [Sulfitobacter]MBQ0716117.1 ParB/RepB/Spo0J family partition protein [Sulfitobacter litoralis]MBQ0801087.1 ParB/RepB/Spo0J family partition protein [Sulfitobacter litoralis]MCF7727398.1 ParB/RepB/Spo0J family partition protein [Sulfitobacter sp. M22]MCF7778760.1 ParB/RepB/Spo0J family partition protein [Sulfitobacter sp. M220]SDO93502.1 chromosome segregation DNA-binding protein [Sulfitobacter litoralis]|tara:strand:- start:1767 stop:2654 length:888 start_codon:yes stop_codon:yes gene_type:complete